MRYDFAVDVDITLGSARDSRGVASIRDAVIRVKAKREKTLRKPNIVYRLEVESREDVCIESHCSWHFIRSRGALIIPFTAAYV